MGFAYNPTFIMVSRCFQFAVVLGSKGRWWEKNDGFLGVNEDFP